MGSGPGQGSSPWEGEGLGVGNNQAARRARSRLWACVGARSPAEEAHTGGAQIQEEGWEPPGAAPWPGRCHLLQGVGRASPLSAALRGLLGMVVEGRWTWLRAAPASSLLQGARRFCQR